ncbi:MAG: hypothetical protein AB8B96_15925 [Lysobacterales bacterium]
MISPSAFPSPITPKFNTKTAKCPNKPAPFSVRLTLEERNLLEERAGRQPLGRYIREQLLGQEATRRKIVQRPKVNDEQLAAVLSMLGQTHLASNLNQLARHANMGTLDVDREICDELQEACDAVIVMRDALLSALGQRRAIK